MKSKMKILGTIILSILFISGCMQQQIRTPLKTFIGTDRLINKNYEIGQEKVAYVGQALVKVKDYKVNRFKSCYMNASDDFVISGGNVKVVGDKNTDYIIRGEISIDGNTYTVVNIPGNHSDNFGALIKSDGSVYSKMLTNNIINFYTFNSYPNDLRFITKEKEEIDINSGYLNYELIYCGTDGKSINISYREYTDDNMARPAFYQDVVYEVETSRIRFKDTEIQIHEATNEKIIFTVTSDCLTE